jgi:hypothetical protein
LLQLFKMGGPISLFSWKTMVPDHHCPV